MNSFENIIIVIGALGGSAGITSLILGILGAKKTKAEAKSINVDAAARIEEAALSQMSAATKVASDARAETEAQRQASKIEREEFKAQAAEMMGQLEVANENLKKANAELTLALDSLRAYSQAAHWHSIWDTEVLKKLSELGIEFREPPPLFPPTHTHP